VSDGTDDHATAAMVSLRRIIRYLRLADREIETTTSLSSAQLFVLTTLAESPALSLAELARRALTDQSSISTVVARLVKRGLVVRKAAAKDKRRAELRLTPAGNRILQSAPPVPQARLIEAIRSLPVSRRADLVRALDAVVDSLGAEGVKPRLFFEDEST
jgi:DNA-binding MarR family transcriptional regulator